MNLSRLFFNKSRSKLASPLILRRFFPDGFPPAGLSQIWKREGNGEESAKEKREKNGASLPSPLALSLSQLNIVPLSAPAMQATIEGSILP